VKKPGRLARLGFSFHRKLKPDKKYNNKESPDEEKSYYDIDYNYIFSRFVLAVVSLGCKSVEQSQAEAADIRL